MACSCSAPEPKTPAPGFRKALWLALWVNLVMFLVEGFASLQSGSVSLMAVWVLQSGITPEPLTMGMVGLLALAANVFVAVMLFRFRDGDSDMRSVWLCSRNDAIGNMAVMAAALGVFGTGSAWPDLIVAAIMGTLAVTAGVSVVRHARADINDAKRDAQLQASET